MTIAALRLVRNVMVVPVIDWYTPLNVGRAGGPAPELALSLELRAARRSGFLPYYQIAFELVSGGVSDHYPMDYYRAYLGG